MFFYDAELKLHINDAPLLISAKVLGTAKSLNLQLKWNEKGQVCGISHDDAQKLSKALIIVCLDVKTFMKLVRREPRVESSEFAERLTDTFTEPEDGAHALDAGGNLIDLPYGRPGWFSLDDIAESGLPKTCVK